MTTSTERIRELLETKRLGDYLPVAGWFHFPLQDHDPDLFVEETIRRTDENGWDFVKIMTNGNYLPIAYGADYHYSTNPHKWDGVFFSHPITSAQDAANLPVLDADNRILAREVEVARRLVEHYRGEKPVIATIFDPLTWIEELSTPMEAPFTLRLLREHPQEVRAAMASIRATNDAFIDALVSEAHVDGFFVSSKFSNSEFLSPAEHAEFVVPQLAHIADKLRGRTWFNLLHVHGQAGLYLDELLQLDFPAYNWEAVGSAAHLSTLRAVRAKTDKLLVAGYDHLNDFSGTRQQVKDRLAQRLERALAENDGGAFVFGPGCALTLEADNALFGLVDEVARDAELRRLSR